MAGAPSAAEPRTGERVLRRALWEDVLRAAGDLHEFWARSGSGARRRERDRSLARDDRADERAQGEADTPQFVRIFHYSCPFLTHFYSILFSSWIHKTHL